MTSNLRLATTTHSLARVADVSCSEAIAVAMNFAVEGHDLARSATVEEALQAVVDAAVRLVGGCDAATISFLNDEGVFTPVSTEPSAVDVDAIQYATREGPCLDAIATDPVCYAEDLRLDPRWPAFGPRAAAAGMRSLLSLRLSGTRTYGSLNMYARRPRAYSRLDQSKACVFREHAVAALDLADERTRTAATVRALEGRLDGLERALHSRWVIAVALGRLMERHATTEAEAFAELCESSVRDGLPVAEVAREILADESLQRRAS